MSGRSPIRPLPGETPFPSCVGSLRDISDAGQVGQREAGITEEAVSEVREEMTGRRGAGWPENRDKNTGRHSHDNEIGKIPTAIDIPACCYVLVKALDYKKHGRWEKSTSCIYYSPPAPHQGCRQASFSRNRALQMSSRFSTRVWRKSAASSGKPPPVSPNPAVRRSPALRAHLDYNLRATPVGKRPAWKHLPHLPTGAARLGWKPQTPLILNQVMLHLQIQTFILNLCRNCGHLVNQCAVCETLI